MKKSFKKVISTAAAVSMLASVASVAASAEDVKAQEAAFTMEDGIVTGFTGEVETALYVPKSATGVADFALANVKADYIFVGADVKNDNTGNTAYLTEADIEAFVEKEGVEVTEENKAAVIEYVAKVIKFAEKDADWTEEELATVEEWFEKNLEAAGATSDDTFAAAIVKLIKAYNDGTLDETMSDKTKDNFGLWVAALPYDNITLIGDEGSDAQAYAAAREALGMSFKVRGDVKEDGTINVRDAAAIAAALANKKELPVWSDFTLDGVGNVRDAAGIAYMLATK